MKNTHSIRLSQMVKITRGLYIKNIGVLFAYALLFDIFQNELYLPFFSRMWSLALRTVKEGYISDHNFMAFFTHPLVLITGILAVASFCVIALWETACLTMILEYAHQGRHVRFFPLFRESFLQILHCLKPKNWMIFIYLLLIQPLIDSDFSESMLSGITIPEFIMDFILARGTLTVLLLAAMLVCLFFFLRYLFLPLIMILERKNFREASQKSILFLRGHYFRTYLKILIASILGTFLLRNVPALMAFGLESLLTRAFHSFHFSGEIARYVFGSTLLPVLEALNDVIIRIFISAMILVVYHLFEVQQDLCSEIKLPEKCVKTSGRIYSFKSLLYGFYCIIFISGALFFSILVVRSENNPAIILELVNPIKIAAHKGYSSKAPENTQPAFALAADCDVVDFIELDIRETRDGVPVVIHDDSLLMPAGVDVQIYDVTFAELQEIPAIYDFDPDQFGQTRIPSLEQVLEQYAGKKDFLIEIKASDRTPELPAKIVALMERYGITETSMIHSGSYPSLKAVKEINPNISCGFIIAVSTGGYADLPYADFFSVEHSYITENMISQIHNRGKQVFLWTVNTENSFSQVRDMDVDMLITDYPEDAYEGIHFYERNLIDRLNAILKTISFSLDSQNIDYNGTGD